MVKTYSLKKDGDRKPLDTNEPPAVTYEGLHIYPVIEYSYRIRFFAGIGSFATGSQPEFYITAGESIRIADLFADMPYRADV